MHERKYLLMIGWTLVSMYVRTFLTIAFSSAVELSLNGDEKFESRARPDAAIRRWASHHSGLECRSHLELLRRNNSVPQGRSIH
jgi:hypothetical protein